MYAKWAAQAAAPETLFTDIPADAYYRDAVIWAAREGVALGGSAAAFSPNSVCTRAQAVTLLWRAYGSPAPKATAMPFNDVPAGSYAVLWAAEQGLVKGVSAAAFAPARSCSRAQIVVMLWRAEGAESAAAADTFTDVASGVYYADAVRWAVAQGIANGTAAQAFSPHADCTRAQIVTFIWRCMR